MGDEPTKSPQLEYATAATVGSITVRRHGAGSVTVTFLPNSYRIVRALIPLMISSIVAATFAMTSYYGLGSKLSAEYAITLLMPAVVITIGIISSIVSLIRVMVPPTIEVSPAGLTLTLRLPLSISRQTWPPGSVTNVFVDRIRIRNQFTKIRYLWIREYHGRDVGLVKGPPSELESAGVILRDALGLGDDPLHHRDYPPHMRWSWITRRLLIDGAEIKVPARFSWQWSLPSLPFIAVGLYWLDRLIFAFPAPFEFDARASMFRVMFFTVLFITLALLAANSWRRKVTLRVHQRMFTLDETSFLHPGHAEWPLSDVRGIEGVCDGAHAAFLRLTIRNETIDLLKYRRPAQIEWIVQSLHVALAVARVRMKVMRSRN